MRMSFVIWGDRNQARYAQGLGVKGGLGNEAVGEGKTQETSHAGGQPEEKDVPVETGGLAQGELGSLGDEG